MLKLLYGPKNSVAAFLAANGYGGHGLNLKAAVAAVETNALALWAKHAAAGNRASAFQTLARVAAKTRKGR